jgi:hypothetical protein
MYMKAVAQSTPRSKKNLGGRPRVDSIKVHVAVPPDEMTAIDAWIKQQPDKPSRPEALRRLAKIALAKR